MSFILNALRKSEQERQSLQPEAVTDRILINHSEQKQSKSAFFYVVLVVGNILLIAAIAWFVHKNLIPAAKVVSVATQSLPTPEVVIKSEPMVTPVPHEVVVAPPAPEPEPVSNPLQSDRTAAQANTTSIAEWVESQTLKAEPLPVRPVIKNKAEMRQLNPRLKLMSPQPPNL